MLMWLFTISVDFFSLPFHPQTFIVGLLCVRNCANCRVYSEKQSGFLLLCYCSVRRNPSQEVCFNVLILLYTVYLLHNTATFPHAPQTQLLPYNPEASRRANRTAIIWLYQFLLPTNINIRHFQDFDMTSSASRRGKEGEVTFWELLNIFRGWTWIKEGGRGLLCEIGHMPLH